MNTSVTLGGSRLVAIFFGITILIIPFYSFASDIPITEGRQLTIELTGEAQLLVESPDKKLFGFHEGDIVGNSDENVSMTVIPGYRAITILEPRDGQFKLRFSFRYDGYVTSSLVIRYLDHGELLHQSEHLLLIQHEDQQEYTFVLDQGQRRPLHLSSSFIDDKDLATEESNGDTTVLWKSLGEEFPTLQVWKFQDNQDLYFELVGETSMTSMNTNIPWGRKEISEGIISLYTEFRLVGLRSDGSRTTFSDPVRNDDSDGDNLSDYEEQQQGTDIFRNDTDYDGLGDFDEIRIFNTDPLDNDSDDDGYSDEQEIKNDSDPIDATSVPVGECVIPSDENTWIVRTACRLKTSIQFNGRILFRSLGSIVMVPGVHLLLSDSIIH